MHCIFCRIAEGAIPAHIVYESKSILCFLDSDPINEGHVLIIPRQHYLDVEEIPTETLVEMAELSQKIVKALKAKYHPEGYSIMQNGGIFNDIGHYHLHVFPRYSNDGFGWNAGDVRHGAEYSVAEGLRRLLAEQK